MTVSVPGISGANAGTLPVDDRMMSRLPVVNQPWPPPEYDPIAYQMRIWDAWWSGDRQKLAWVYYNLGADSPVGRSFFATTGEAGNPTPRPGQFRGGLLGSIEYSFWGTPTPPGEKRTKTHVPLAGDMAQTSASLLFAKPPVLRSTLEGKQAAINNAYFETLIDDHMHRRLREAAERCAAHGGVYLRVVWDESVRPRPWIVGVPAGTGVPEFRFDVLSAVTFWQTLVDDGDTVVRHLEKHVPGQNAILHGLYQGDQTDLGDRIGLDQHPVTARLASDPAMGGGDTIYFPDQPMDAASVVYVPNMTPNRVFEDLGPQAWPLGRSDYSGVEALMDNLDEAYSSWIRDVQLAKARIITPPEYLDNIGRGKGAVFDPERRVYSPLNMLHDDGGSSQITLVQFAIRWQEHKETCADLTNRILEESGYSPQSFGIYDGNSAITATEVTSRERKTILTRGAKINYWRPALADIIYGLMTIERSMGNTLIVPERPDIEFIETIAPDMLTLANTAQALRNAEAASMQTMVTLVHPDWTPDQVNDEVDRILAETGSMLAGRARITLAPPMGESLTDEVQELAGAVPVPPQTGPVPGTSPTDPSTGGSTDLVS